ncbi:MAG: ATP-sensitive inward rectifier potassium channel 10 [Kamptonema sp. SIO4C4]|nr:ATP-sensitive inward rectifier potassium channel 10 [Kamptonema sp. SIO4C4]
MRQKRPKPWRSTLRFGTQQIIRDGVETFHWGDLYHHLFTMSWGALIALISLAYILMNLLFAVLYLLGGDCIENAQAGSFPDAFFFSVQTMATIGYGAMYPTTPYSNALVVIEVFIGLLGVAMATGLMFARFSLPSARVLFSRVAVICPYHGVPTLMFRTANQRRNFIIEAQVRVTVLLPEETPENHKLRRLHDLALVRSNTPTFSLSWTIMHPIEATSPLYGLTPDTLDTLDAQIIVTLTGLDETLGQTVHARYIYHPRDIFWNSCFVDVLHIFPNGDRRINYAAFHDIVPFPEK